MIRRVALSMLLGAAIVGCGSDPEPLPFDSSPSSTVVSTSQGSAAVGSSVPLGSGSAVTGPADVDVLVDLSARQGPISPLILGFSATLSPEEMHEAGITLSSWGGNPSTRYNYDIGHAWNNGADYEFRNTHYGLTGDASRDFLRESAAAGVQTRLAVPMLGWVARNDDPDTCSFPDGSGGCLPASEVGTCDGNGPEADPTTANVESTPAAVGDWVRGLVADGFEPDIIAMDNEPELWGSTHYDVHPSCPTYEEILEKYLTYAEVVRDASPNSRLAGPVMCCWYDYWRTAPGPNDGSGEDFLGWFLRNVKAHDDDADQRTIDLVDVHYYPQSDVFNDKTDDETNARRLRSTQSLSDPDYVDESWIGTTIDFIPRIKDIIEQSYPGTPLIISEWNFGADSTMNGALAIADTLGIFGREGVEAAAYWRYPEVGSPGYFAFKMHGNYDDHGSRFGGEGVSASSSEPERVSSFAALDEDAGVLRVMLLNKDPDEALTVDLGIDGVPGSDAKVFTYGPDDLTSISSGLADLSAPVELAPSSITLLEIAVQ